MDCEQSGTCAKGVQDDKHPVDHCAFQIGSVQHNAFDTFAVLNCHRPHWNVRSSWHRGAEGADPGFGSSSLMLGPSLTTWKHGPPSLSWPWFEARGKGSYCQWEFLGRPFPASLGPCWADDRWPPCSLSPSRRISSPFATELETPFRLGANK